MEIGTTPPPLFFETPRQYLSIIAAAFSTPLPPPHNPRHSPQEKYMIPMIIGSLMELTGYTSRYLSIQDPFEETKFIVFYVSVIMHASHPTLAPLKKSGRVFFIVEILTLLIQVIGAVVVSPRSATEDQIKLGTNLLLCRNRSPISLIHMLPRNRKLERTEHVSPLNPRWKQVYSVLILSSFAVLIRSIFRMVELNVGYSSELARNELHLYGFDFLMMSFACVCLIVVHPGAALKHTGTEIEMGKPAHLSNPQEFL
ncbi:RTA1-domain-containing protein [Rhizoclosmatium globosum]|uniref:RTA1-domain-containing protein n=1 Tax=Rhizoclosmatium globosum TaxID=329046 RepID=A0A1Y2CB13_9FUNG|nr:RTA1-domain-containing protein [Rhizoclosmatium globosum]|eukprot:ORY44222.1 RTA1-domain-containing protein [Rhizoclosmatium globosum]